MQIIQAIINYTWLFLMLLLVWRIWKNGVIIQKAQQGLISAAIKQSEMSAEASQRSAAAAEKSAESALTLARRMTEKL